MNECLPQHLGNNAKIKLNKIMNTADEEGECRRETAERSQDSTYEE